MSIINILKDLSTDFFMENSDHDLQELVQNGLIDPKAIETKWLGNAPASIEEIERLESRLGTKLPESYIEFLLASNGFGKISFFLDNLLSTEAVDWAKNTEETWWFDLLEQEEFEVSDEEYFDYSQPQDEIKFRGMYLRQSIKVSEWHQGMCIFLNPVIRFGKEWEVIEYATWFPGARRYKSFRDFLHTTHTDNQERIKNFS